jgi:pseudaminic acid synthase
MIELEQGRVLGNGAPCLLIAEVSANHDQDLDQALALVDIAADAGWHCLKLQTYSADSLSMPSTHPSVQVDPIWGCASLYELYQSAAMPMAFHEPLFKRARERGLIPFTSVYDPMDLDFVEDLGCGLYKIASFEMTFDDLLIAVAGTRKPLILSTGMAKLAEVDHALEVLSQHNSGPVVLLHCCSSYPAPLEDINLCAMDVLRGRFGKDVGFSDHTIGSCAPITAAAMGAVAIEKHYTNDPNRPGPDHRFSATPDVMAEIAQGVGQVHIARGQAVKDTTGSEASNKLIGRRSAFALHDLPAGHKVSQNDFRFVRPGVGVPPFDKARLIGARLKAAVPKGHPIMADNLLP